jgi:hypothetical protein
MKTVKPLSIALTLVFFMGLISMAQAQKSVKLSDEQIENIVKRSYQYVAMYNVNNKGAMQYGGWNIVDVDTELKDHNLKVIARPNNDSLYITCMLDLRKDPVILDMPAFDSKYVSLMVTGYDHYVNIPMSTRQGDFKKPEKMLFSPNVQKGIRKARRSRVSTVTSRPPVIFSPPYFALCPMPTIRSASSASRTRCSR